MSAKVRLRDWAVTAGMNVRDGVKLRFLWPKRPERLNVEIIAVCDAKCIHCPRQDMDRAVRPMAFELFKKVVDEAADLRVPALVPNGYGEILTMPRMGEYLAYVRSKRHDFRIVLNTNGYNMTDAKIEILFEHRVNVLNITIDGATAETAQHIRVGLKTERIENNIHQTGVAEDKTRTCRDDDCHQLDSNGHTDAGCVRAQSRSLRAQASLPGSTRPAVRPCGRCVSVCPPARAGSRSAAGNPGCSTPRRRRRS